MRTGVWLGMAGKMQKTKYLMRKHKGRGISMGRRRGERTRGKGERERRRGKEGKERRRGQREGKLKKETYMELCHDVSINEWFSLSTKQSRFC